MASKNISVQEEVYDLLLHQKLPGESFSQMFRRTSEKKRRRKLSEYAGVWADIPDEAIDAMKAEIREGRKTYARDFIIHPEPNGE